MAVPEIVNPIPADEIPEWASTMAVTFHRDPYAPEAPRLHDILRRGWEPDRAWGVRDRGRWVATLRTEGREITVPGVDGSTRELSVDALTNVTVAATHRRRGILSAMLSDSLRAAHERGDAISVLIAAEWPIYGRFGYGPAVLSADYELRSARPGGSPAGDPGRLYRVDRTEAGAVAHDIFAAARPARPGQMNRSQRWWNRVLGLDDYAPAPNVPSNWLIHEGADGPDGLVAWGTSGEFGLVPPFATVEVWDLTAASAAAYRDIWAYLCGIDGTDQVRIANRPVDEPLRWLLRDGRALVTTRVVDLVWVRILDVPAALTARRYGIPGEIVLEVADNAQPSFAAGRYALHADGDDVRCEPTRRPADVTLTAQALGSAYLGGIGLHQQTLAGTVTEHTPGAVDRAQLMFSAPRAPWNCTWF